MFFRQSERPALALQFHRPLGYALCRETSGRGDYTAIVDGSGRLFFRFGAHIQLFRRFVTPSPCLFWSSADIAIFQRKGLRRSPKLSKPGKT
ncbi:MAG: hypothetical protein E5W53_19150 [Mesorhizobium sp.]|nr:MAG: hypothetical protein E5W53_19150 [Mesorhizobium sp.]TIU73069.1 MAG: hypothetical protein E5W13_24685 [Mesorhizobium sp.]